MRRLASIVTEPLARKSDELLFSRDQRIDQLCFYLLAVECLMPPYLLRALYRALLVVCFFANVLFSGIDYDTRRDLYATSTSLLLDTILVISGLSVSS